MPTPGFPGVGHLLSRKNIGSSTKKRFSLDLIPPAPSKNFVGTAKRLPLKLFKLNPLPPTAHLGNPDALSRN
jgi:hypothetical protein